jgi:hypothetical protein
MIAKLSVPVSRRVSERGRRRFERLKIIQLAQVLAARQVGGASPAAT